MSFQKKVMILCDTKNGEGCGILRFTMDGNILHLNIKMQQKNINNALLLVKIDGKIFGHMVNQNDTIDLGNTPLSNNIQCLILDNEKPVYYSTTSSDKYSCFNLFNEYKRQNLNQISPNDNNKNNNIIEENTNNLDTSLTEKKVENSNGEHNLVEEDSTKNTVNSQSSSTNVFNGVEYNGQNYYLAVKPQLDEMFVCYTEDATLNNIVPNSKWIKIENDDEYYSVGIIFDLDEPTYITYAIPGIRSIAPPNDIKDLCSWLPRDINNPNGDGYYVLYQDAKNGKTLKIENN